MTTLKLSKKQETIVASLIGYIESHRVLPHYDRCTHVAALVSNGKIVNIAYNQRSHHAEIGVIAPFLPFGVREEICSKHCAYNNKFKMRRRIHITKTGTTKRPRDRVKKTFDIWVIRHHTNNLQLMSSKPCAQCIASLKASGIIDNVIYSDENGDLVKVKIAELEGDFTTGFMCAYYRYEKKHSSSD